MEGTKMKWLSVKKYKPPLDGIELLLRFKGTHKKNWSKIEIGTWYEPEGYSSNCAEDDLDATAGGKYEITHFCLLNFEPLEVEEDE